MLATLLLISGLLAGMVLSAFYSGTETGVYCLNPVRLRVNAEGGDAGARRLEPLMRRTEDLVITMLLGTNLADYVVTACTAALLLGAAVAASWAEIYAAALATPLIFVFGAMVPKESFRRRSDRLMPQLSWAILVSLRLAQATGLVWLLHRLSHALVRWIDPRGVAEQADLLPRARTLHLLREGAARGGLTHLQRDLIERVLNLSEIRVRNVMIPRARAAVASVELPRDEFLRIARMAHFSRLPVYRNDPRRIVGVVNVYDVLTDREDRAVAQHVRPPLTLPENESVSAALVKLQRGREAMAIVQDRAGNCAGILTLKDLVEEIVGDLEVW